MRLSLVFALALSIHRAQGTPLDRSRDTSPIVVAPTPPALAEVGIEEHLGASLPLDLAFRDHTGANVRLSQYFDRRRPVLINLMYHRCTMLCSVVLDALTDTLRKVEWTVGVEFDVISISIDPHDSPDIAARKRRQILAKYERPDADHGWHFLTADETEIARVADALGFRFRWDPEQKQYAHPAAIFLVTPEGKVARYLYGVEFAPRDVRFGLLEASEGRSVSTVERILLFCYHYDATGHRYTLLVNRVIRFGAVVLLLLVGGLLAVLWKRERRDGSAGRS
ncbi:MAG: SCO family protein [Polyangiales bacterium]